MPELSFGDILMQIFSFFYHRELIANTLDLFVSGIQLLSNILEWMFMLLIP